MTSKGVQLLAKISSIGFLCFIYYWLGYEVERPEFALLFTLYTAAFALSGYLYLSGIKLNFLIGLCFLFKLIFLVSIPELSQDFYRFIWDGMLINNGYNPYLHLPVDLIEEPFYASESLAPTLYTHMGELSATNYSTYPPLAQLIYAISYGIGGSSLLINTIVIRLVHILAELCILWFGLKLLQRLELPKRQILFFIMNPLVILESTFSLHFEVVMLAFLVLALVYLYQFQLHLSAISWAGAVAAKLLPLMFIPLLFAFLNEEKKRFNWKQIWKFSGFCLVLGLSLGLAYLLLWDSELISKNSKTLGLYFSSFEFNASLYYVLRWLGYQWSGYNMIALLGKAVSLVSLLFILFLSFRHKKISFKTLLNHMVLASTVYYLCSTTVHPWYIMLPLLLSVFTTYKYMLVWSWLVFMSYSAYKIDIVEENYGLILVQYLIVIAVLLYEVFRKDGLAEKAEFLKIKGKNSEN